ncbi:phage tailspike protein [Candidatus Arsenophonus triatominarum]|uniref:phage tailspike protein n=1 Tax=Candidatus Arsenophonus triatominarum TaxID=57911 RepID=UPI0009412ED4
MSDIMPNVVVSMPSQLFTLRRKFAAASNGKVYIGKIDRDPPSQRTRFRYILRMKTDHMSLCTTYYHQSSGYPVYNGQLPSLSQ